MKEFAIKENHLFVKAYQKGKKYVGKHVVVYVLFDLHAKRLQRQHPMKKTVNRIGFTVSKKTGGAVVRNRCKRIMRQGYRDCIKDRNIKTGFLIVIAARDACAEANAKQITADMTAAFAALRLFEGMPAVFDSKSDKKPSYFKNGKSVSADKPKSSAFDKNTSKKHSEAP